MVRLLLLEGNIGAGKSTICNSLYDTLKARAILVQEPVNHWVNWQFNGYTFNLLKEFYTGECSVFEFQTFIICSLLRELSDAISKAKSEGKEFVICERSIICSVEVFSRIALEKELITDKQFSILLFWVKTLLKTVPDLFEFDTIFYLFCDPSVCLSRVKLRGRDGEQNIDLGYLENIHKHSHRWYCKNFEPAFPKTIVLLDASEDTASLVKAITSHLDLFLEEPMDE